MQLGLFDSAFLFLYIAVILIIGIIVSRKPTLESFFANNRNTNFFFLTGTTLATTVGAGVVLGVASASFQTGISFGALFLFITVCGWLLAAWLAPRIHEFGRQQKAYTMTDYLLYQYKARTTRIRSVSRIVFLLAYLVITAIQFIALAQLLSVITGFSFLLSILIGSAITISYIALAGLRGDFSVDSVQALAMIPLFLVLLFRGFQQVPSPVFADLPANFFDLYAFDGPLFFWFGIVFGIPLVVSSADVWQRAFAAKSGRTARLAFYWTGIFKLIIITGAILLGLLAFHLVPNAPADGALFALIEAVLPVGLKGVALASVLAILISTVDSSLMIGSSILTKDFYRARFPQASEKQLLKVGRVSVFAFGAVGLILAIFVQNIVVLTVLSAQVLLLFSPALLGGLIWERTSEPAAFWSITAGAVVTLLALVGGLTNIAFIPGVLTAALVFGVLNFPRFTQKSRVLTPQGQ